MSTRLSFAASPLLLLALASTAHAEDPAAPAQTAAAAPAAPPAAQPAPASASASPSTQPAAPPGPQPTAPVVELRADDEHATIERRIATSSYSGLPLVDTSVMSVATWQQACVAPCQVQLDPHYTYRVAGDGLVPSGSFALPRHGDHVRVDAKMGSQTGRVLGIGLTGLGALGVGAGALALGATPILESQDVGSKGFRTAVLAGGATALAFGLVTGVTGLYLWLSNGSSAEPKSDLASTAPPQKAAKLRLLPNGAIAF